MPIPSRRFGVSGEGIGIVYTRTGRRFFSDATPALETELLEHLRDTLTRNDAWSAFSSDWFVFDCELMPWSVKAEELLRGQYASVGAAAIAAMTASVELLRKSPGAGELAGTFENRSVMVQPSVDASRRYCWPVTRLPTFAWRRSISS